MSEASPTNLEAWQWIYEHFRDFSKDDRYSYTKYTAALIDRLRLDSYTQEFYPSVSLVSLCISTVSGWPDQYRYPHVIVKPQNGNFEVQTYLDVWPDRGYWNDSRPFRRKSVSQFDLYEEVSRSLQDILKLKQE